MTWQTVDSAPKDGEVVIVASAGCWSAAAYWHDGRDNYWKLAGWYGANIDPISEKPYRYVTHWMPLPPPPEVQS